MRIGMIISRLRREEKLLVHAFHEMGAALELINDGDLILDPLRPDKRWLGYDLILQRSLSSSRATATLRILEAWGIRTLNRPQTVETCADKLRTTLALAQAGVPQADVRVSFAQEACLQSIEELGYPSVLKPLVGSWGRLLAKINDRDSAEAILEDRFTLGSYSHKVCYVQRFVDKTAGRDIRTTVVGRHTISAIYRQSLHWITNTARGGVATNCPITPELDEISRRAAAAVGGGILAIDIFETERGYLVNEVNHNAEFRNSIEPTGIDIPARMAEYALDLAACRGETESEAACA
jgi:[lysine-biosynthesis-protein LysW]--L-2-aminoadipate ligase